MFSDKNKDSANPVSPVGDSKTPRIAQKTSEGGQEQLKKQMKILHMEDELMVAKAMKRMTRGIVEPENMQHAVSAEKGLEILEKDPDFDLILLDLRMQGMGGIGLIKHLLKEGRQDLLDKIVAVSGTSFDLTGDPIAFGAIRGRFLEKPGESAYFKALFEFVSVEENGGVINWKPPEEKEEVEPY